MSKLRCFFGWVTDETSILLSEQSFFETQLTLSGLRLMIFKLFVFRHAETFDNSRGLFSGWRDSGLTLKGLLQAQGIAEQLKRQQIDYAFASHLRRARKTLEIVLQDHPQVPVFTDDRLIERCYGLLQGKDKRKVEDENPDWYAQIHRGYGLAPPEGESLEVVEKRVISFLEQLREWLKQNPGNVAISCHNNSIRSFRRVFENLSIAQMCKLESPQDCAIIYEIQQGDSGVESPRGRVTKLNWKGVVISRKVKLATDALNLLKICY
jgi:2,3-bisphosphoglycerate-dependent phosphoglycerate mutase